MKKQVLKAFLVLLVAGSASTAMASITIIDTVTIGTGSSFTPSSKVGISITAGPQSYAATSAHLNGTKQYGTVGGQGLTGSTANDPSKVYSSTIPTQATTAVVGVPDATSSATALPSVSAGGTWQ